MHVCNTDTSGRLTSVMSSVFADTGQMEAVRGTTSLISVGTDYLHNFTELEHRIQRFTGSGRLPEDGSGAISYRYLAFAQSRISIHFRARLGSTNSRSLRVRDAGVPAVKGGSKARPSVAVARDCSN